MVRKTTSIPTGLGQLWGGATCFLMGVWGLHPSPVKVMNEDARFDRFGVQPQLEKPISFHKRLKIQNEKSWFHHYSLT